MHRIHYFVDGDGPDVILAHGWAASYHDWDELLPCLVQAGYRVYVPDHLGHGGSEKPEKPYTCQITQIYAAFCQWIESLGLTHPFKLVGHSMGGYIGLRYAAEDPERLSALGLIDPLYSRQQMSFLVHQLFRRPALLEKALYHTSKGLSNSLGKLVRKKLWHAIQGYYCASPAIAYTLADFPSLESELSRVVVPTMLLYGKIDLSLQPRSFHILKQKLPHLVACHGIRGAGHTPHVTHARLVNRYLLDFLNG